MTANKHFFEDGLNHFYIRALKLVSMIKKYHNHKLQTIPRYLEEEPYKPHKTQEDKLSKATSSLFPIKMIAKLE